MAVTRGRQSLVEDTTYLLSRVQKGVGCFLILIFINYRYVISTVGPQGEYPEILTKCYSNCLTLLSESSLRSIAFPCISTGVYGYPNTAACSVALRSVRGWLEENKNHEKIDRVVFCLFLQKDQDIYSKMLPLVFPLGPEPAKL